MAAPTAFAPVPEWKMSLVVNPTRSDRRVAFAKPSGH